MPTDFNKLRGQRAGSSASTNASTENTTLPTPARDVVRVQPVIEPVVQKEEEELVQQSQGPTIQQPVQSTSVVPTAETGGDFNIETLFAMVPDTGEDDEGIEGKYKLTLYLDVEHVDKIREWMNIYNQRTPQDLFRYLIERTQQETFIDFLRYVNIKQEDRLKAVMQRQFEKQIRRARARQRRLR